MLFTGVIEKELSDRIHLTYFNVIENDDFDECLNQCLPSIWLGPKDPRSLEVTKTKISKYFESKLNNRPLVCGSVLRFSCMLIWDTTAISRLVLDQILKRVRSKKI